MSSDDEIVVSLRFGARLRGGGDRVLGPALFARRAEEDLKRRSPRLRAGLVPHLGRLRRQRRCSSTISTRPRSSIRSIATRSASMTKRVDHDLGGSGRRRPSNGRSAPSMAAGCSRSTSAPRRAAASTASSTKPEEVPEDLRRLRAARGAPRDRRRAGAVAGSGARSSSIRHGRSVSPTSLRTLQNLGLAGGRRGEHPAHAARQRKAHPRAAARRRRRRRDRGDDRGRRAGCATRCGRCRRSGRPTIRSTALVLREGLTGARSRCCARFRNHLLQIRPNYNAETVNGVLLRNSARGRAPSSTTFAARFDPAPGRAERRRDSAPPTSRSDAPRRRSPASFDDEILRGIENLVRATVRTNFYQRPERPVISIKVESARSKG